MLEVEDVLELELVEGELLDVELVPETVGAGPESVVDEVTTVLDTPLVDVWPTIDEVLPGVVVVLD